MRYLLILLVAFAGMTLWQSCKTTKHTLDQYEGPKLIFGTGGGFTGMVQEYVLLPNGQLFIKKNNDKSTEQPKLKKKQAKKLFKMADDLKLLDLSYNKPGNKYYFIGFQKESKESKVVWGREKQFVNPQLDTFYKEFMKILPQKKSTGTTSSK